MISSWAPGWLDHGQGADTLASSVPDGHSRCALLSLAVIHVLSSCDTMTRDI